MSDAEPEAWTEDAFAEGRLRLRQPLRGHRFGTDAVLLAKLAPVRPGDRVIDLGSASGAVGLLLAVRHPDVAVTLVERDPVLVQLARENIELNGLADRMAAVEADVFSIPSLVTEGCEPGRADLVVTNPPFFERTGRASPDPGRRNAHVMSGGGLREWIAAAAALLKPRGRLAVIHRADALPACLDALGSRFGSLVLTPVETRPCGDASRIVLSAVLGGRAPFRLAPSVGPSGADKCRAGDQLRPVGQPARSASP